MCMQNLLTFIDFKSQHIKINFNKFAISAINNGVLNTIFRTCIAYREGQISEVI